MPEPTLRTYCTGGDLFGVGAVQAGYRVVDGFEIDPRKAEIARLNGHHVYVADVTRLDQGLLVPVDHEHWSPSCKTASQANSNGGETPDDIAVAEACAASIAAHAARGGRSWSLENVWGYRNFRHCLPRILEALTAAGFVYEFEHINMADFGVPQTRKRLILWAVHRSYRERAPLLHPTHRKGGDMFHAPWVGWYSAIADLIPTLPPTEPAPWQQQRMGRLPEVTTLIGAGGYDGGIVQRPADEPAFTMAYGGEPGSTGNTSQIRAYLVSANSVDGEAPAVRDADEPAVTTGTNAARMRAYLIPGGGKPDDRAAYEPAHTVTTSADGRARALLLDGSNSRNSGQAVSVRPGTDPAFTLRAGRADAHRACLEGRWVRLTLPCLARFQTVPDDYKGLTAEINGNGVPPRFARALMETLHERSI